MPSFAGGITPSVNPGTRTVPAMLVATQLSSAVVNIPGDASTNLVAAVAGKTVRLFRVLLIMDAATSITFKSAATALSGPMPIAANGGFILDFNGDPWYQTVAGEALVLVQTGTANIGGTVWYGQS